MAIPAVDDLDCSIAQISVIAAVAANERLSQTPLGSFLSSSMTSTTRYAIGRPRSARKKIKPGFR
jgi:hypothetical protein